MLCFPLDNTEYEAVALGAWLGTRTRGVFSADGNLAVTAGGGMTIKVSPGLAWLKVDNYWGAVCLQQDVLTLPVSTAESALPRIDAVCARINKAMNKAEIVIKKGTPQTAPQIPAVTRNDDYDEIYLATVRVPAGAISINAGNITDQRLNNTYCGVMRDGVTGIPTQDLYNAWYAWFEKLKTDTLQKNTQYSNWLDELKTQNSTTVTTWIDGFIANNEADFLAWFSTLQNTLDNNQASNLYNMIHQHLSQHITNTDGVHGMRINNTQLQFYDGSVWVPVKSGVQGIKCNGTNVATDANCIANITRELLGAQKTITIGTVAPSGGSNGDIYIQI